LRLCSGCKRRVCVFGAHLRRHPAPFYYDLGLIYEINGRLDDAEAMHKKAAALEMNDIFLKAISSVRQAKEDQKKLAEQQRAIQ